MAALCCGAERLFFPMAQIIVENPILNSSVDVPTLCVWSHDGITKRPRTPEDVDRIVIQEIETGYGAA